MSHSTGAVRLADGFLLGYFEYDATSDVACRAVQATQEEVDVCWRTPSNDRDCVCPSPGVVAVALHPYAEDEFSFLSRVCLACMTIVGDRSEPES
jgi:hypothetical protein